MPRFLTAGTLVQLHDDLLRADGGLHGMNMRLVETVAAYPRQKFHYERPTPDIPMLGACLAYAAATFHAFADGNKRLALAALDVFLISNGFELRSGDAENVRCFESLAAGEVSEREMIAWVVAHSGRA